MKKRLSKKIVMEGAYLAEVPISIIDTDLEWSPCISIEDAARLDEVREALRKGDLSLASKYAKVYSVQPITIPEV